MKTLLCTALMLTSAICTTAVAYADDDNPWMVRGRLIAVIPDEGADLTVGNAALAGDVAIGDQYVPELDISYFFTKKYRCRANSRRHAA